MESLKPPSTAEGIKSEIAELVDHLQQVVKTTGYGDDGHEIRERHFNRLIPRYAHKVFELAKVIGREEALNQTAGHKVSVVHYGKDSATKGVRDYHLNQRPQFAETLLAIALARNTIPPAPHEAIDGIVHKIAVRAKGTSRDH